MGDGNLHAWVGDEQDQGFSLGCKIYLPFMWWNYNHGSTILGFHPFTFSGKLAVNVFVVILTSICWCDHFRQFKNNYGVCHGFIWWFELGNNYFKVITFGANGVIVFWGVRIKMRIQMKDQNVPFIINIHSWATAQIWQCKHFQNWLLWGRWKCVAKHLCLFLSQSKDNQRICYT